MTPEEALNVADEAVYAHTDRHLTDIQRMILRESLADTSYEDMQGYQIQHIKNEGSKLWRLLSEALGQKVSKTSFRAALEKRLKSGNIGGNAVGKQETPVLNLLTLEIQQDCDLLQQLLEHNDNNYLSDKWTSCFSKNRNVWQDLSCRLSLVQSSRSLMELVQDFYQQVDAIEESCQKLLALKSRILPLESKQQKCKGQILVLGTMKPPEWTKDYFMASDAVALVSIQKIYHIKFKSLKETVCKILDLGNRIVRELNQHSSQ
ncbi:MAG: hypothetical protein HC773_07380 [Scytonema sp. CRU_2_7]|nr:hypothetical protein [Scytonema sp. CRU_2_7]